MLLKGLTYPPFWPLTYIGNDMKHYVCIIMQVHHDTEPYYTVDVLEGPYCGERQTINERLTSWVDSLSIYEARKVFDDYIKKDTRSQHQS